MIHFTPMVKLCYITKWERFCRFNCNPTSVDFELIRREIILDGPGLIRRSLKRPRSSCRKRESQSKRDTPAGHEEVKCHVAERATWAVTAGYTGAESSPQTTAMKKAETCAAG